MDTQLNVIEQTNILHIKSVFTKKECDIITKEILEYKEKNGTSLDRKMSYEVNEGCWMGQPQLHNGFSQETESLLIEKFRIACNMFYQSMPKPFNSNKRIYENKNRKSWEVWAWANVNEPGSENREHVHTGYFMSGVAYFRSEGTGMIEFIPQNYLYKTTHVDWPYHSNCHYEPVDGDILMFPSYLLHKVERNNSNKQRISMAFNATLPSDERLL